MAIQRDGAKLVAFILVAIFALAVNVFIFEMRYMWYLQPEDANFLRAVYLVCVVLIIAGWLFFPSKIAIAIVGLFALGFPHLFYAATERPLLGREIDIPTIGIALISVALLVAATHLRRRYRL